MVNKTSMLHWWPKVKDLDIPMPKTEIVLNLGADRWMKFLDGMKLSEDEIAELHRAADNMGYPCFMRTDLFSGKHSYEKTCLISKQENLLTNLFGLVDGSFARDIGLSAVVVREFLELEAPFKAFGGLPIAKERRYFAEDGEVMLHHPYWPEEAIIFREGNTVPVEWQELLRVNNVETQEEVKLLSEYACEISEELEGPWSIDFAQAKGGTWYFIDAAEAMKSWIHPDYVDRINWR